MQAEDPAVLQIRIVEGEGLAYGIGSRSARGITVQVTDETGKPVEGASVSFKLPDDGPGGTFSSGSKTEIATTAADGRANVWGMQWNRTVGAFEVRITAAKGQARAGTVCPLYLNDAPITRLDPKESKIGGGSNHMWLWIGLAALGAAGASAVALRGGNKTTDTIPATGGPPVVSSPTITVGHP